MEAAAAVDVADVAAASLPSDAVEEAADSSAEEEHGYEEDVRPSDVAKTDALVCLGRAGAPPLPPPAVAAAGRPCFFCPCFFKAFRSFLLRRRFEEEDPGGEERAVGGPEGAGAEVAGTASPVLRRFFVASSGHEPRFI